MKRCLLSMLLGSLIASSTGAGDARPAEISRGVSLVRPVWPIRRLSSGALSLLDQNGDLVKPPIRVPAWLRPNATAPAVMLDLRVGSNIPVGVDPAQLPSNQRAQAEPHIMRSPTNPDFLVATFQEGRFATIGGALDCGFGISRDGGLTWTRALIPGLTRTLGGTYFRATDPVAAIDQNGNIYLNTLTAVDTNFNTGAVVVSRSTDGGLTFLPPAVIYRQPNGTVLPDKNWIAANTFPGSPHVGRLFATFTLFSATASPIVGSFSDNGGVTWSQVTFTQPSDTNAQGSQPVFLLLELRPRGRARRATGSDCFA
jgi:hypothetical protein